MVVERAVIGTPSSSAFRSEGAITLVLPTESILSRLELLFRYGMYRSWTGAMVRGRDPRLAEGLPSTMDILAADLLDRPEYEI